MLDDLAPSSVLETFSNVFKVASPEAAMRIACRELLRECGIDAAPVPLKPLLSRLGIQLVKRSGIRGSGALRMAGSRLEVVVNTNKTAWRRERFTIAHEIAHVLFLRALRGRQILSQSHDLINSNHSKIHQEIERLCNLGAAEILMPTSIVSDMLGKCGLSQNGLRLLYDSFLVSYQALLFRIPEVLPASAMILWREHSRHNEEAVALRVSNCHPRYDKNTLSPWLPQGCTSKHITPDIVTKAFNTKQPVYFDNLVLEISHRPKTCIGIATVLPEKREREQDLPIFDSMSLPDENPRMTKKPVDAILLVGLQSMSQNSKLWSRLKEVSI